MEEFVVRVFKDGRVTLPKQLRERFEVKENDYVRLMLVEVLQKGDTGAWVKRRVE